MVYLEPPPRAILFAENAPEAAHRTRSDPQRARPESAARGRSLDLSASPRAVTFSSGDGANAGTSNLHKTTSDPVKKTKGRKSIDGRKSTDDDNTASAYYDSRASTRREFRRRASNLLDYYKNNPALLPQLPYTLRRGWRRWKVIGMAIFMVLDACIVPIILYYALTFGANIAEWIIFAIVATVWGGPTYVEFASRGFKLIKKEHFYRPLGTRSRWTFDATHYVFIMAITAVTAFLATGSAPHNPWIRVLSMPAPSLALVFGGCMFAQTMWAMSGRPAPFRISSTDKGEKVKPGVYTMIEDIVAVDGGAGRPYREALGARYSASPRFRKLMLDLSLFWSIPALLVGIACTIVVCVHSVDKSVAYGIGWAVPFIWAGIWTAITIPYVHQQIRREHEDWDAEHPDAKRVDAEVSEPDWSERGGREEEEEEEKKEELQQRAGEQV